MIKPNMPNMPNIPGMGAMTDTLDFVKNLWGGMGLPGTNTPGMPGMNIPGMVMPTLSVEEINKKISDLKAVETWLALNMNMLRGTIQALEVQSATISTLQTMGQTFTETMKSGFGDAAQAKAGAARPAAASSGTHGDSGNGAASAGGERGQGAPEPTSKDESDAASLTAPLVNAAAWWNMLQDQFKQAVTSAMEAQQAASTQQSAGEKPDAKSAKPKASESKASESPEATSASSSASRKRKPGK